LASHAAQIIGQIGITYKGERDKVKIKIKHLIVSLVGVVIAALVAAPIATAAELTVNPAGGAMYTTIAAAVAAANPLGGDIILCAPGTYTAGANLNKPVILRGAQWGVDARDGRPGASESVIAAGGFALNAVGITIDGFTFTNMAHRTIDTYFNADNFTMRNCILKGTQMNYQGGAIQFGGPETLHANGLLFEQNLVQVDCGPDGGPLFMLLHAMDNGTIRNNKINGGDFCFGPFGARTGWLIEGNEFDGDALGNGPYYGFGFNANLGNVVIRNNYVHEMLVGIGQISVVGGSITNNTFDNNSYAAFQLWGGEWGSVVSANVLIENNTISYNGKACTGYADASHGIRLRPSSIDASTIHIHNNCFTNLGVGTCGGAWAIRNNGSGAVDAKLNWWGTTDSGVIFTMFGEGAVDYDPWLTGINYAGDTEFAFPASVVLKASVATSLAPVADVPVRFSVGGVFVGSALTDSSGVASFDWGTPGIGTYSIVAECAGGCLSSATTVVVKTIYPMSSLIVEEAKIDWKKKPDDDKIHAKGRFILSPGSNGVDITEKVTVTIGLFSETISMELKGKDKWEYKRPEGETGIKYMTIDWKGNEAKFDIHVDNAELGEMSSWSNPVLVSLQIGDDKGSEPITMKEHKHHWDYRK
jgi:hypothetical protein